MLVVLDLRQLSFMDAAGLRVICAASENAGAEDRRVMLLRGPAQVDRLFTLTGLSEKLTMFDVARREGNLAPVKTQLSARDRVNATDKGRNRVDGITPGTLQEAHLSSVLENSLVLAGREDPNEVAE